MIIDELVAILGYKVDPNSQAEIRKYEQNLKSLEKTAYNVGRAIGRAMVVTSAAAAAGFTFLGKAVLDTAGKFEQFQVTLETIEGSSAKAKKSMDWISQFARTTPYEVEGITAAFVKLKAYGIDPMDGTLKTLGDTASAMGKDLNQAVEAFADAATGEFERLKEFGIKSKTAGDEVTFSWVENGKELSKTVKKSGTEITKFLGETFERRFGGAMEKQSKTFKGMMSNLGDAWTGFLRRIADTGFFDQAKKRLGSLLETIDRWDKDGTLQKAAEFIGNIFNQVAEVIGVVAERIGTHVAFINKNWETFGPIIKALAVALGALFVAANPITALFVAAGLALDDFFTYMEGGDSVIGAFLDQFPWIEKAVKGFIELMKNAWSTFEDWWNNIIRLRNEFVETMQAKINEMVANFRSAFDVITKFWEDLKTSGQNAIQAIVDKWNEFLLSVSEMSDTVYNGLVNFGVQMGEAIYDGLVTMKDKFVAWFMSLLPDWMRGAMGLGPAGSGTIDHMLQGMDSPASYRGGGGGYGGLVHNASYGGTGGGTNDNVDTGGISSYKGGKQFTEMSPRIMADLKKDFNLSDEEAAAVLGNLGHESGGFKHMQEISPTVRGSRGGWGWAQWTGPRRRAFEAFARSKGLDPRSYEANYAFLRHELKTTHRGAVSALKSAEGLEGKTRAFENQYERAGVKGYRSRYAYARRALESARTSKTAETESPGGTGDVKTNFDANTGKTGGAAAGATINNDRSVGNSSIMVQAPVNVHVARADQAPDATARAVGGAVTRGAGLAAKPARMQGSAAA